MHLRKKLTSRLSKVIPCLNPSIDEFEIVTVSRLSQHPVQNRGSQAALISPTIPMMASHPLQSQLPQRQPQHQQDRRKKRHSMVSPADEQDLFKINGMLVEASKTWKQTHHRKKLMAFPSKKFNEHQP